MFLGEFLFITNIPTIILLIIYMRKQVGNYIDKKRRTRIFITTLRGSVFTAPYFTDDLFSL